MALDKQNHSIGVGAGLGSVVGAGGGSVAGGGDGDGDLAAGGALGGLDGSSVVGGACI